ncbi:MAG: flagellar protein FlaG [Stagnimonas sp.]|nr:flagellar protein FlaG [Stagnimonas sp.]
MSSTAIPIFQAATPGLVPVLPVARPSRPLPPASNDELAPATPTPAAVAESPDLPQAVAQLNRYVARSRTDLQFRIDDEAGRVVVSIVDADSGQVLRQMPSEEALRIARYLEGDGSGLLDKQA